MKKDDSRKVTQEEKLRQLHEQRETRKYGNISKS